MPKLRPGDSVAITGLDVEKYNGLMGTVLSLPNRPHGLLEVEVFLSGGQRRVMSVKPRNVAKTVDEEQIKVLQAEATAKCWNVLGGSAGAVLLLVGVFMFIVNERKHVAALSTQRGGYNAVNASCLPPDGSLVGSLLYASCPVSGYRNFSDVLGLRGMEGPVVQGLRLDVDVQVYQWIEVCEDTTTCTYGRGWVDAIIPVDDFRNQRAFVDFCARDNLERPCRNTGPGPEWLRDLDLVRLGVMSLYADEAQVGGFVLPEQLVDMIGVGKAVTPLWMGCQDPPCTAFMRGTWQNGSTIVSIADRMLVFSGGTQTYSDGPGPTVGDVRVGYTIYTSTRATVLAEQAPNGALKPWAGPVYNDGQLFGAADGDVELEKLVDKDVQPLFDGIGETRITSSCLFFVGMVLTLAFCQPKNLGIKQQGFLSLFPVPPKRFLAIPFAGGFGIVWGISVACFLAACVWAPYSPEACGVLFVICFTFSVGAICWGYQCRAWEEEKTTEVHYAEDVQAREELRRAEESPEPEVDVQQEMDRMVDSPLRHYTLEPPPGVEPLEILSTLSPRRFGPDIDEAIARETRDRLDRAQQQHEEASAASVYLSLSDEDLDHPLPPTAVPKSIYVNKGTVSETSSEEEMDNMTPSSSRAPITPSRYDPMNPMEVSSNVLQFKGVSLGVVKDLSDSNDDNRPSKTTSKNARARMGLDRAFGSGKPGGKLQVQPALTAQGQRLQDFESPNSALGRASLGPIFPRSHGASPDLLLLSPGNSSTEAQTPPQPTNTAPMFEGYRKGPGKDALQAGWKGGKYGNSKSDEEAGTPSKGFPPTLRKGSTERKGG